MSERRVDKRRHEDSIERCISEYLSQGSNVILALNYAFVKCYFRYLEKSERLSYLTLFSKVSTLRLMDLYSCQKIKNLLEIASRRVAELRKAVSSVFPGVLSFRARLLSRLTIHCASKHLPLEVSLAWDPILNLPYIPASSIKGLIRHYFESNRINVGGYTAEDLFGSLGKSGLLVFFDAYPVECKDRSLVEAEVLTPHYREAEYIIDEARSSPVPIIYPVIASGAVLEFIVAINSIEGKEVIKLYDGLRSLMKEALSEGIGARTALGYGRFALNSEASERNYE